MAIEEQDLSDEQENNRRVRPPLEFETHKADVLMDWAYRTSRSTFQMFLIGLAPTLILVLAAALMSSSGLVPSEGWDRVLDDWHRFWHRPTTLPASAQFPLLRDYTTILIGLVLAANVALGYRQWGHLRRSFSRMDEEDVLQIDDADLPDVISDFDDTNERIKRMGARPIRYIVAASAAALTVVAARLAAGLYLRFAGSPGEAPGVSDLDAWSQATQDGWWASPYGDTVPFFLHLIVVIAAAWYIIKLDMVAIRFVRFWWRNKDRIKFRIGFNEPHQFRGYEDLRGALVTATVLIALDFVALVVIFMSTAESTHEWLAMPVLALGFASPTFILLPMALYRRHIRTHRREHLWLLQQELEQLHRAGPLEDVERRTAVRAEIAAVKRIPVLPFSWPKVTITAAAWLISLLAAIEQLRGAK